MQIDILPPIQFDYSINGKMSFLPHIEAIISKSSRMLGFIKRISREFHDPYTHKTLYTSLVRPNLGRLRLVASPVSSFWAAGASAVGRLPLIMIKLNFQTCFNRKSFSFFKKQNFLLLSENKIARKPSNIYKFGLRKSAGDTSLSVYRTYRR
jgi:hypothetical protein